MAVLSLHPCAKPALVHSVACKTVPEQPVSSPTPAATDTYVTPPANIAAAVANCSFFYDCMTEFPGTPIPNIHCAGCE